AQGILGSAIVASAAPLADAMGRISPTFRVLILAGAGISIFGMIAGDNLGTPRILFAFARHGYLPRALGRVQARSHSPHVAIIAYSIITVGLAATGSFADLVVVSTLFTIAVYIAACPAAWVLARRGVALNGAPLGFKHLGAAAAVGIVSMAGLMLLG